jgi:predicted Zn-dependent protease
VDRRLGDAAFATMTNLRPAHVPEADAAVREMVDRLTPHARVSGFEYRTHVVASRTVNAFALPGGQIVVFTGLIARAARPEQVAGVLGHEIAHVTLRHGVRSVARTAGLLVAVQLVLGQSAGLDRVVAQLGAGALLNGYSREQEREADAEGVRAMAAAGLDPTALAEFFDVLRHEPGTSMPGILQWMQTHPGHDERIATVHRLAAAAPRGTARPLSRDWAAVHQALRDAENRP